MKSYSQIRGGINPLSSPFEKEGKREISGRRRYECAE